MKSLFVWAALLHAGTMNIVLAQPYPAKTIRLIVPAPAGGGTDIVARLISQKLIDSLGRPVIVENRGGGNGVPGTDAMAKAAPDGYTIGMGQPGPLTIAGSLSTLPYDPVKDLLPIILANESPHLLAVHPSLPVRSVKELVALGKARSFNAAVGALATVQHLLTEMLNYSAGIKMTSISYKGGAIAVNDVVGGNVEVTFSVLPVVMPFISNGKLRLLAVASEKRILVLPNVPTMGESGWPKIVGTAWNGVVAPAGTPKNIIDRLNMEIARSLVAADVKERYVALGMEAVGGTPEAYGALMRAETVKWAEVIKAANIKLE